jgi:microcystin-dependent protein
LPTDSNGVYSLPLGYLAVTGATIQASQHNPPLEDIGEALTGRLPRSGAAPMSGPLREIDGTAPLPAFTFNSDPTTGMFKTVNGIGFAVGGTKVAEFVAGGGGRYLGELIPMSGRVVQPLTVLPFGQTLSRVTYASFWVWVQAEIAAGNTLYNNGDGSTTFGIIDARGYTLAAPDNMGGPGPGRTDMPFGATRGTQAHIITPQEMPAHRHFVQLVDPGHAHGGAPAGARNYDRNIDNQAGPAFTAEGPTSTPTGPNVAANTTGMTIQDGSGNANFTAMTGSNFAMSLMQPTLAVNFALFVGA